MYVRWAVSVAVAVSALPPLRATWTDTNVAGYLSTAVAGTRTEYSYYTFRATFRGIHTYRYALQALDLCSRVATRTWQRRARAGCAAASAAWIWRGGGG